VTVRLAVVGDVLLDRDLVGRVERICPDAPVPVVDGVVARDRPGGAGLAAWLAAASADVTLISAVEDDDAGRRLRDVLDRAGVRLVPLRRRGATPVKMRVRVGRQSLLRVDLGESRAAAIDGLTDAAEDALASADAVLVADYGGGVAASEDVRSALTALATSVPVVWDPHPRGAAPVPGCSLVTPNADELRRLDPEVGEGSGDIATVIAAARRLCERWKARAVSVTRGSQGAILVGADGPLVVPAPDVAAIDVCGAGDRFAAEAAVALGDRMRTADAVERAVLSASAYVASPQRLGFEYPWTPPMPAGESRARTVVATSGCFDLIHAGHVRMLTHARSLGDRLVVLLNDDASVRRLKGEGRPVVPEVERAEVLSALSCVDDVVLFSEDTPERALAELRPAIFAKGADYNLSELPEARIMASWGGETVILPYEAGRSTTDLIARSHLASSPARS
jgi:D-beta-D-heptose 7-phosphate kinase/D-beta-D-heptose 1-phosphate adenosyltransferase